MYVYNSPCLLLLYFPGTNQLTMQRGMRRNILSLPFCLSFSRILSLSVCLSVSSFRSRARTWLVTVLSPLSYFKFKPIHLHLCTSCSRTDIQCFASPRVIADITCFHSVLPYPIMSCPAQSSPDRVMNSPSPNYTRADRAAPSQRAPLCCVVSPACDDASYPNLPCPRRYTRQYHVETAIGTSKYEARKRCLDLDGYAACVCVCV